KLSQLQPFEYGNDQTILLLFTILAETAKSRDAYLDLRRITDEESAPLSNKYMRELRDKGEDTVPILRNIFSKAMDKNISLEVPEVTKWETGEDKTIEIGGHRFLYTNIDNQEYLITINGGLAPLNINSADYGGRTL